MIIRRTHILKAFNWETFQIEHAEDAGLESEFRGNGRAKHYQLLDIINYLKESDQLNLQWVVNLIKVASDDAINAKSGPFDITEALEDLAKGTMPLFPDAKTAQTLSSAHKNFEDTRMKEQERRVKAGELVDKSIVMREVNRIASLYEEKMGESLFRKFEKLAPGAVQAVNEGRFYEFVRQYVAEELDECVDEVNRIEAQLQEQLG